MKSGNLSKCEKPQISRALSVAVALLAIYVGASTKAWAQNVATIYPLPGYNFSSGGLVADAAGNLFGGALDGSTNCIPGDLCGMVFELSPTASGWNPTIIYNFTGATDGGAPTTEIVFDTKGNLYGASPSTIFRLSPSSGGSWSETTLYTFTGKSDGAFPTGPLAVDAAGNVYGTTSWGGSFAGSCSPNGCGVAFELSPNADGTYTETVLHTFTGGIDGRGPVGGVTLLGESLYGATGQGGNLSKCSAAGCGVIFKLRPSATGWQETVLHSFSGGADGANPFGRLVADSNGNLFGIARQLAFELTHASGRWQETVLHRFTSDAVGLPVGGVVLGAAGNLFGESDSGSCSSFISPCGVVYELSHTGNGWSVSASYQLGQSAPSGDLLLNRAGDIFGIENGPSETGVSGVFEIRP